jgi:RimJ/RimL family protein N-acetyltransferase
MLRLAQPNDVEDVFRIYMHTHNVPYLGYDPLSLDAFTPIYAELLAHGSFFVWARGSRITAFCRSRRLPGRTAHVAHIGPFAVAPDERGTGVACDLLTGVIERLRYDGVLRVELIVSEDNPRALAFYRKMGFQHEGTMRLAYKRSHESQFVNDLLLAKLLVLESSV